MHDYKFDTRIQQRRNKKTRLIVRTVTLLAIGSIVWSGSKILLPNNEGSEPLAEVNDTLVIPNALTSEKEVRSARSQHLAIPKQQHNKHYSSVADRAASNLITKTEDTNTQEAPSLLRLIKQLAPQKETAKSETPSRTADLKYIITPPNISEPTYVKTTPVSAENPNNARKVIAKIDNSPSRWVEHKIKSGESLAKIFKKYKLSANLLHRITYSSKIAKGLADIMPGQILRFKFDSDNKLLQLILKRDEVNSLHIKTLGDTFVAENIKRDVKTKIATASGVIQSSLFVDALKSGLTDNQVMELSSIFGWDIDFALDIRAGDQFKVVYEEEYLDGKKYRNAPILAAEFTNRDKTYRAVRFKNKAGEIGYYSPDGHSKRRAFIRTPLKYARISSGFSKSRWHPVLKKWRSHKGVDYASPTGTAIKATGSGKVIFRGWKGGYGRVVIIQHGSKYQTLYAHMSRYAKRAKKGSRVKQGQIIGYVGASGLASGPHLHYEFRVNGVHRNPLRVKLPKSTSLARSQIPAFKRQTRPLLARLGKVQNRTLVAKATTK